MTGLDYSQEKNRRKIAIEIIPNGSYGPITVTSGRPEVARVLLDGKNAELAPESYGETLICATIMHNGQEIRDCGFARVMDLSGGVEAGGG